LEATGQRPLRLPFRADIGHPPAAAVLGGSPPSAWGGWAVWSSTEIGKKKKNYLKKIKNFFMHDFTSERCLK
jgi:hypothetical protein